MTWKRSRTMKIVVTSVFVDDQDLVMRGFNRESE